MPTLLLIVPTRLCHPRQGKVTEFSGAKVANRVSVWVVDMAPQDSARSAVACGRRGDRLHYATPHRAWTHPPFPADLRRHIV